MVSIKEELRQNRPFKAKSAEAVVSLLRTADLIRRSLSLIIEPNDITVQQYNVLRILRGAGEKGLPTLDIATRMIEETPGITRLIDKLEAKKLVVRERCATDRRQVFCTITKEGLDLLDALDAPLLAAGDEALSKLRKSDLEELLSLLDKTREGLHATISSQRAINEADNERRATGARKSTTRKQKK